MTFEKLEYKSYLSKYIVDYLTEQKSIGHNVFYVKYILRDFDNFLSNSNDKKGLSKHVLENWLTKKNNEEFSTRKTRVSIIKNFSIYLSNYIDNVYIVNSKMYYTGEKFIPYIFSEKEIKTLFNKITEDAKDSSNINLRIFELIINILFCCGTRITETLNIKLNDINLEKNYIVIRKGKGNKERLVPITKYVKSLIQNFIIMYRNFDEGDAYIFKNSKTNKSISIVTIRNYFKKYCKELQITNNKNKFPRIHDLRHNFIVFSIFKLEREGKDINAYLPVLSSLIGHENITSTMYYLKLIPSRLKVINQIETKNSKIIIPLIGDYIEK